MKADAGMDENGFTLIEQVIVIAVIGIMVGISGMVYSARIKKDHFCDRIFFRSLFPICNISLPVLKVYFTTGHCTVCSGDTHGVFQPTGVSPQGFHVLSWGFQSPGGADKRWTPRHYVCGGLRYLSFNLHDRAEHCVAMALAAFRRPCC